MHCTVEKIDGTINEGRQLFCVWRNGQFSKPRKEESKGIGARQGRQLETASKHETRYDKIHAPAPEVNDQEFLSKFQRGLTI